MNDNSSALITSERQFIAIPSSVKLAILIPTARWTAMVRSVIASFVGVANEEVAVLIADNSESEEKRVFLQKICAINPHILVAEHPKAREGFLKFCRPPFINNPVFSYLD